MAGRHIMIHVDDNPFPWRDALTVADLLEEIPEADQYAVIRLNGRYVSRPDFEKTTIPDNARIFLIPLIAGG